MHYWNKDNFESLEAIAEDLRNDPRLCDLVEYCRLRATGLRRQAFEALDLFVEQSNGLPSVEKRDLVDRIYAIAIRSPDTHQFVSTPLDIGFLRPALANWLADKPSSLTALRWDGIFGRNSESLKTVLERDTQDILVRRILINRECLSPVSFAVHHIDEGALLLDLAEIEALLTDGEAWLDTAPAGGSFDDHRHEVSEFRRLVEDWKTFRESGADSFPDWCAKTDRHHVWIPKYYYEK